MNRLFFWLSAGLWLVMMGLLLRSDVLPDYLAKDNPGYGALLRGVDAPVIRNMAVFKDNEEVGSSQTTITPHADGTYSIANVTSIELRLGMLVSRVRALLDVSLDKDKELEKLELSADVLGSRATATGTRQGDKLKITASLNGQIFQDELPYENGLVSSYFEPFALGTRLRVGQVWHTKILDPLSQQFTTAQVRVTGTETLELKLSPNEPATKFSTYKVVMDWGTSRLQAWAAEDGLILKQETPLGYTLVYRRPEEDDTASGSI